MEVSVNIYPEDFFVFGVNVGQSVVLAWGALAVVVVLLVLANLYIRRRFTEKPKGLQLVLEMTIGGLEKWARGYVGESAPFIAPVTLTLMVYVFSASIIELFGLPAATGDINCAIALGLTCFIAVNVTGLRYRGIKGRIAAMCHPTPIVFPIRVLTDLITPFSMAIRLFANILVGAVIMEMIYHLVPLVLPAAFSSFFTVFEIGIQVFVIGLLSLIYTSEAVE
jgi:F-type H+-transporting ATPase subunit a